MKTCLHCEVSWKGSNTCWCCGQHKPRPHPRPDIFHPYNGSTVTAHDNLPVTIRPATLTT